MLSPAGYVSTLDGGIAAPGGYTYPTVAPLSPYGVSSYTAGAFTNVEYIPHRLFVGGFSPTVYFFIILINKLLKIKFFF